MLTPEQLHLFESYDRMFVTDGWKELVDDFKNRKETDLAALLNPRATAHDLVTIRARTLLLDYIIGLENNMKEARKAEEQEYV